MSKPKLNQPYVYQYALNNIVKSCCPNCHDNNGCLNCNIKESCNATAKYWVDRLQDLIDMHSQPKPTIEEVKQEWENDGWKWKEGKIYIELIKNNEDYNIEISIDKIDKTYCCFEDDDCDQTSLRMTLQEHIRLTKTFRVLGCEV